MDKVNLNVTPEKDFRANRKWNWWPLFPLYPYGNKSTEFTEIVKNNVWSFDQLQGVYYVAVPIRLTVIKVSGGLMLFNPLPPTTELIKGIKQLEDIYGPVLTIVLPTSSGLEHKIAMPAMARVFREAELWISPGQWTFPVSLPLEWIGLPKKRTKILLEDGFPHEESCQWDSLGPIDIGLGRFQEFSCYHKSSCSLLVTDALVSISSEPPSLFNDNIEALLFHSRETGEDLPKDTIETRKKGWRRLILFSSFLRPEKLKIPSLLNVLQKTFKPGLRSAKYHFGLYPFSWQDGWEDSVKELLSDNNGVIVPPVVERLVFPRAKSSFLNWLERISNIRGLRTLVPAHYSSKVKFTQGDAKKLLAQLNKRTWPKENGNWEFLSWLDSTLLDQGIVPSDPMKKFRD